MMYLNIYLQSFLVFIVWPILALLPPEVIKHPAREVPLVTALPTYPHYAPFYRRSEYIKKPFTLECEAVGDPAPRYRWTKNGFFYSHNRSTLKDRINQIPGKGTLVFFEPNEEDAGTYQCFAENERGIASSDRALVLTVRGGNDKKIDINVIVKEGLPLKIPCKIPDGWPKWEVHWLKDFKPIQDDRIKEDPEGSLLFAYTKMEDMSRNSIYLCMGKTPYVSKDLVQLKLTIKPTTPAASSVGSWMTPLVPQYISPKTIVAISGQSAALYCIYGGNPMPYVKWSKNLTEMMKFDLNERIRPDDINMSILRITQVKLSDQGNYTCHIRILQQEKYSNTTTLIVHESPVFKKIPRNMNITEGETAILYCIATGVPQPKVTWYKNGEMIWSNIDGHIHREVIYHRMFFTELELTIDDVTNTDTGNYACNISNEVGYVFKDVYINVTKARAKSKLILIATSTLVVIATLLVTLWACKRIIKKWKRKKSMVPETSICQNLTLAPILDPWQFNRARLILLDVIGEGNFGKVYLAEALFEAETGGETKHNVAVKTTHVNAPDCARTDLLHELDIMKKIEKNLNVVKLIGACTEKSPTFVIMELLSESLHQFLRKARTMKYYELPVGDSLRVTSQLLMGFALQTAKGMKHVSSQGIIHRDLASRNILLSSDLVCKVADFGLAREVNNEEIYTRQSNAPLPIRWMAPESLSSDETNVKSDVWSFGVVLWELVTLGATPYPGKGSDEVRHMVCRGECMQKPVTCDIELHNIMAQCWRLEPQQRPDFIDCCDQLERLLEIDAEYIQLQDFPEDEYLVVDQAVEESL